jgi:arginine N-succinyltransferase
VMGVPHPSGRAALRMLEGEGFRHEGYIDIFDGGPTVAAPVDEVRSIREARQARFAGTHDGHSGLPMLVAAGRLDAFACCYARVCLADDGTATLDDAATDLLGIGEGDLFLAVAR